MQDSTIWVGLDVHKDSITAAILEGDASQAEVVRLSSDLHKVRRLFRRLSVRGAIRSCYEASGAGFVLHRALSDHGYSCEVVAPSLIPRKPGDRRKTDRIDAVALAKLLRSGHLTPVEVPTEEQEAVRGLVRYRAVLKREAKRAKHRVGGFLLRQGLRFDGGRSTWTRKHRIWLAQVRRQLKGPAGTCLSMELEHLEYLETQLKALDAEIERIAQCEPYRRTVEALQCLRGVKTLTAMTLATEIGDVSRFRSPRALMAWVGLVPSERSSGDRERRGPITKAGSSEARRVLIEAAWNNRHQAGSTLLLKRRRQGQDPTAVAIAVKAQHRLSKRFGRLWARKHPNVAVVSVARELCGFVWAIMRTAPQHS
jgi:transposase